jgi:CRISPR-associated protein Cas2
MMVVLSYDVNTVDTAGQKRLRNVAKACEALGCRVQNSVFELLIDPAQLTVLKDQLSQIIDPAKDSVRFYRLGANWKTRVEAMGKTSKFQQEDVILL